MLCAAKDRIYWTDTCPDCGGCTDDRCVGCSRRWCGGMWVERFCDRCPEKVDKQIKDSRGKRRVIRVRCNGKAGHSNSCHWSIWEAGRRYREIDLT